MKLSKIKKSTQEVAEAIAAVLDVDVTIIDNNMYRVAATGRYREQIGEKLPENCSFEMIAKKEKPEFIDSPNFSQKCIDCVIKGSCSEMASLGYPIMDRGKLLGVIGVLAFDLEQKQRIHKDYESLLVFLNRLGNLLAGNLNYTETITKLTIQDKMTNMIINEIDNGIILTDNHGKIKVINSEIERYFLKNKEDLIGKNIYEIIPNIELDEKQDYYMEKKVNINGKKKSLMIKNIPVTMKDEKVSNIIKLNETSNVVKNAYMLIEGKNRINFEDIIGESEKIIEAKKLAKSVAKSDSAVLLRGESGTGKDLFARAIHNSSDRKDAPFIAINCASIPDSLLESELFGYDEGAFTGAKKEGHIGKFELANGGTLFLDEIGDMPLRLQPKILRVLQDQKFMRVGGKEVISVNFRLITATNKNLEQMIAENKFRDDLYYRINVIPIHIPALRERKGDIDILVNHLMERYCNKLGVYMKFFSPEVKEVLNNYNWLGNIRELENVIEYLINTMDGDIIEYENLPYNIKKYISTMADDENLSINKSLNEMIEEYEKQILIKYLQKCGNTTKDKQKIAKELSIDLSTLYRKLGKYNLQ